MIKAIIFDMDGVLIEAKEWHYEALNRALKLFGYEITRAAHLSTYDGLPTKKKAAPERLFGKNGARNKTRTRDPTLKAANGRCHVGGRGNPFRWSLDDTMSADYIRGGLALGDGQSSDR